ncbi:transketolase family protein, partial [Escherichia coli]|nr:transketolase family protein [Escherichia coli]
MINLAPAGQKDSIEMRKVYADFIAQQSKNVSSVIALEADLMSSMAMDSVAQYYPCL